MRSALRTLGLPLSAWLLASCAVGPDYHRPMVAAPASFMGQAAIDARQATPASDPQRWWAGFGDPVLVEVVDKALAQNLDLAQAVARVSQARGALQGVTGDLLPSGGVTGGVTKVHASRETPMGRLLTEAPGYQRNGALYEADLEGSWEIDVFGGLRRNQEAARAEYQAARADVAAARLTIAAQSAETYVAIRGLQARLAIARQQTETQSQLLKLVQLQFSKGAAAELQVRQAEGVLAQTQASVPALETALEGALNALDVLLGEQPGADRELLGEVRPVPHAPGVTAAVGPADLIRRRPDLIVAERRLQAANAGIGVAVSEYYPKLSLSGLVGSATTSRTGFLDGPAAQAQGVLGLRWRLFDFVRVNAEVAQAKGREAEALAAYRQAVLRATQDVETSFSDLVKREAQAQYLAGGEASFTRARDASLAAYKSGVVSLIEVLDADTRLLATRDARAQAETDAARAAISSFRALGGGWGGETRVGAADNRVGS
jgi:NodT family efflux transporter outer membrane factor (OMF) lipoprotein